MATRGPDQSDKTDRVVAVLEQYERPFMGTGELADELGYTTNPGVKKHLDRAVEQNKIEQTAISGYNVWYLPDLVRESEVQGPSGPAGGFESPQQPDNQTDNSKDSSNFTSGLSIAALAVGVAMIAFRDTFFGGSTTLAVVGIATLMAFVGSALLIRG